jgi:hypothetical protein
MAGGAGTTTAGMLTKAELDAIIDRIRQREIPPELQAFVQELAHNREAPRSWLGRLMFGRLERPVACKSVAVHEGVEGLRGSLIFDAGVDVPGLLEWGALPGRTSHGTFVVRLDGFHYLNRRRDEVEALFRQEPEALGGTDPAHLAAFLSDVLGRRLNESHEVLRSAEHLVRYDRLGGFGGAYEIDAREWQRVRSRFIAPTRREEPWGFRLEFCSVYGWMHYKRRLTRQTYDLALSTPGPDVYGYRDLAPTVQVVHIQHSEQVLSEKIFARLPMVKY